MKPRAGWRGSSRATTSRARFLRRRSASKADREYVHILGPFFLRKGRLYSTLLLGIPSVAIFVFGALNFTGLLIGSVTGSSLDLSVEGDWYFYNQTCYKKSPGRDFIELILLVQARNLSSDDVYINDVVVNIGLEQENGVIDVFRYDA